MTTGRRGYSRRTEGDDDVIREKYKEMGMMVAEDRVQVGQEK